MKLTKTHVRMTVARFRKTLPEEIQHEYFRWFVTTYDIAAAHYLIQVRMLPRQTIDVKAWCEAWGNNGPYEENAISMLTGVNDKEAMQDKINLDFPLIIAEHVTGRGKDKQIIKIIIDGNKRIRKAFLTGREKMDAYYLPVELAKLCTV